MEIKTQINHGVYLVVDPSLGKHALLSKLNIILQEQIVAVQLWDNFSQGENNSELIQSIISICHVKNIPVLINNKWDWINEFDFDGVHFDSIPQNFEHIKKTINRSFITGLTCNNDLSVLSWADKNHFDYISFCSIFPSGTSNSCELVQFDTIRKAKELTAMPVFLAGGIKPGNIAKLKTLPFAGIAVISGIMNSDKPNETIKEYLNLLRQT